LRKLSEEEEVFRKLRKEKLPYILQGIVYSYGISYEEMLRCVKEYENNVRKTDYFEIKKDFEKNSKNEKVKKCFLCGKSGHLKIDCRNRNLENVKCFKCNKYGHYSNQCVTRNDNNNVMAQESNSIDETEIILEGKPMKAIFVTGASVNMICSGALKKLNNIKMLPGELEFTYFDGTKNKTIGKVNLKYIYNSKIYREEFNVAESNEHETILISNTSVRHILNDEKIEIPITCSINTKETAPISWNRPIRSWKDKADFEELVLRLENEGVIEPSTSDWLNPVVLTRKKDGSVRFCVDFRRLNELVEQDEFEIPRIDELISHLNNMKYFSLIDLKDGFFQIKINENDKKKTAFYTGKRLMQFTRMPQGYRNNPAVFQRAMNYVLGNEIGKRCLMYIDDILVFGKNIQEHDENLKVVEKIIQRYGLKENLEKKVTCVKR
jgi:hypothetical protein